MKSKIGTRRKLALTPPTKKELNEVVDSILWRLEGMMRDLKPKDMGAVFERIAKLKESMETSSK